jgi:hypothetical protein
MKKSLLAVAMAAMLGLFAQVGTAKAFLLQDRSPNVTAGQIIAGGGMMVAYWSLACHGHLNHCRPYSNNFSAKWYGLTTVGCFALSPIIGGGLVSLNEQRELRSSEVAIMIGDCVLPILGGWIMKAAYDANPQWDAGTGRSRR